MLERVLSVMTGMKNFMVVSAVTALVVCGIYMLALHTFRWTSVRVRIFGIFYGLGKKGMLAISFLYLRLMFILTCLVEMADIKLTHVLMIGVLGLAAGVTVDGITGFLRETGNSVLILAGLLAGNLLVNYMREIQFDWSIMAVYGLLGTFIVLYSAYFAVRDLRTISKERQETDVQI